MFVSADLPMSRGMQAHIPEVTLGEDATTATKLNSIADALKHSKALVKIDLVRVFR